MGLGSRYGMRMRLLSSPRALVLAARDAGLANGPMRFGFSALPTVFDALVGPLVTLVVTDRTRPVAPTTGSVLASQPEKNRLHGRQVGAARGLARNVAALGREWCGSGMEAP